MINLEYAVSLQFVDRLEKDRKIKFSKKVILREVVLTFDGEPRAGNIVEFEEAFLD